jgi:hypothetical protein
MKKYFPLIAGILALVIETMVFLSLMELPPFGKGDSDIIWGLPFFGLIVLGLTILGLRSAMSSKRDSLGGGKLATAGLVVNGLGLAIPILLLLFGIIRAVFL